LSALNDYLDLNYEIFYWRTSNLEVDFVLYGENGLLAVEVKRASRVSNEALRGLKAFKSEYPQARCVLAYGGDRREWIGEIEVIPLAEFLKNPFGG
jgi:predicted AAA+ superfamily ATPase